MISDHLYEPVSMAPIAYVHSPFKERYGVPRQAGLAKNACGYVQFINDPDIKTALKSIETFSHIWVVFIFHNHGGKKWKPSIRPPRLGGRVKVGVLASRSPHRPNPIGISVLQITHVDLDFKLGPRIEVSGLDLLDGTPVLDIKPYIPYSDAIVEANPGWATQEIKRLSVFFSKEAQNFLDQKQNSSLLHFITEILELDPRPAYLQRKEPPADSQFWNKVYGIEISNHEVKYLFNKEGILVVSVVSV